MKAIRTAALILIMTIIMASTVFASDSRRKINSVHITVDQALRNLESTTDLPDIDTNDFSVPDNNQYEIDEADWYNSIDALTVASTPKIELYLTSGYKDLSNGDEVEYYFAGNYSSSSITVTGGTYVSSERYNSDTLRVVIALKGVKGEYDSPDSANWSSSAIGLATWNPPAQGLSNSGYYSCTLYRDNQKVVVIKTNGLSLNLYPWMEKAGEYNFEVRTIAYTSAQEKYGKDSVETCSDNISIIDSNKSDGSGKYNTASLVDQGVGVTVDGQTVGNTTTNAGWYRTNSIWYFKYPNGTNVTNNWLEWNNLWYHFDGNGAMQVGWQQINNYYYYLKPTNGDMKLGWLYLDGKWYYLETSGTLVGTRVAGGMKDIGGKTYYFDATGAMQTGWITLPDSSTNTTQYYYFYPQTAANGNNYGFMARSTTIDGFTIDANGRWTH